MFITFPKTSTPRGEQRWIHPSRVTRVSLATDSSDEPILALCFDGPDKIVVHGSDPASVAITQQVTTALKDWRPPRPARHAA